MTVFPGGIDDDRSIVRIDDNLAQLGTKAINQLREAVFAIEKALGVNIFGSAATLADRLDRSLTADGDIKSSALTSVGLVTLPIDDAQVGINAGIKESKLALNHSTVDLYTQITANQALLNSTAAFATTINSNLLIHITGGLTLLDGSTLARHVGSQIDLNNVPSDGRDPSYIWGGLKDKDGNNRTATTVNAALDQINTALITHENATTPVHPATAVAVDTSNFTEIPADADTAQKAFDAIDDTDRLNIGDHRAVMHDNGVPRTARSETVAGPDGYSQNIVPVTPCNAFLVRPPATSPVDNNAYGDDVVVFSPDNTANIFDSQFTQVKVGDIIRINYGNGIEGIFPIESIGYQPGVSWVVRLNGNNLSNTDGYDAYARIDRPLFDDNTYGVFACAAANNDIDPNIMGSLIVGNPRGATALGLGFDPNQLDASHYMLYLNLYPTGNPTEKVIQMPGIDVTGNAGVTPGQYTIDSIVQATNNSLRAAGYNYRFMAFNHKGEFGIMLADAVDGACFSIINGVMSGGTLSPGAFSSNVVADADTLTGYDALGLGRTKAGLASPDISAYSSAEGAANYPTIVIPPLKNRNAIVNGVRRNAFIGTFGTEGDGYWVAEVTDVTIIGATTVEVEYTVEDDLCQAELKVGKTILVQPTLPYSDSSNLDVDYGRYIIKEVAFSPACGSTPGTTTIRVVNGVHATTNPVSIPSNGIRVRLYFGQDAVSFSNSNIIDSVPTGITYNRLHEVYIDDLGNTFTHERARMPQQVQTPSMLSTQNNWTITNVSPKLRGFRDGDGSFRKYLRFYVLNYNQPGGGGTGEYDGYIGRRSTVNADIFEFGEIVRARKNIPARFYDATNLDYIEIMYTEPGSASTDIMTTNSPRYVDIEVFPSLELDDEVFLLATCELEGNTVERVVDRREFGTISEKNFSTSAISLIESGDRYLHANGVLRGLSYQGPTAGDPSLLNFNGGAALVNGHISILNDGSVRIPEIYQSGTTKPQSYDWAICVNDKDQFEPILLTNSKKEFFATGTPDYYVPSVTFTELVNSRPDLTPISIVNVTISSMSVNSVTDVRKFVGSGTSNLPLTLVRTTTRPNTTSTDEGFIGNFSTMEQLLWWLDNDSSGSRVVRVKGYVSMDSAVDLSGVPNITFDGEGSGYLSFSDSVSFGNADISFKDIGVIFMGAVTSAYSTPAFRADGCYFDLVSGLGLHDNVEIRNCTFGYYPTTVGPSSTNNIINADIGGCIYFGKSPSNVLIENCKFTSTIAHRPPFINVYSTETGVSITNFTVRGCRFDDTSATDHCAICIGYNDSIGELGAGGVHLEDNFCVDFQSIVIGARGVNANGMGTWGVNISNNVCGVIGFSTAQIDDDVGSLVIENNTVRGILGPIYLDPVYSGNSRHWAGRLTGTLGAPTGQVIIANNHVNGGIGVGLDSYAAYGWAGMVDITNNKLTASEDSILTTWGYDAGTSFTPSTRAAIAVFDMNSLLTDFRITTSNISGNVIMKSSSGARYIIGIYTTTCGNITNNVVSGLLSGFNAECIGVYLAGDGFQGNITGNRLFKDGSDLYRYIEVDSLYGILGGVISENILESWDTGSGDPEDAITWSSSSGTMTVERNKNHRHTTSGTVLVHGVTGRLSMEHEDFTPVTVTGWGGTGLANPAITSYIRMLPLTSGGDEGTVLVAMNYNDTTKQVNFDWLIPLADVIPDGASITSISLTFSDLDVPEAPDQVNVIGMKIYTPTQASIVTATTKGWDDLAPLTFPEAVGYTFDKSSGALLDVYTQIKDSALVKVKRFNKVVIGYDVTVTD